MASLEGKVGLVTGAASGQGAEHARRMARAGARVAIADILVEEGAALAAELGERAIFIPLDVGDVGQWEKAMVDVVAFAGGLDLLVNNAAIAQFDALLDTTSDTFARHQRVNELGVFLGMKHAAPLMRARGQGSIVNVSSLGGLRAGGGDIAYVSSKWAVRGMTKSAAKELGPDGIRVNSIHPGLVMTAMVAAVDPAVIEQRKARIPLGRAGVCEDISNLVLFLLSDASSYITGAEIVIDGGLGL